MTPPQLHIHFDETFKAGIFATRTVGEPGAHGAAVTGIHGIGVSAPKAAAVAAATIGLAMELHIPNGKMLTIGLLSIIFAIGIAVITRFAGSTFNMLGAAPKEHCIVAPPHTICPITILSASRRNTLLPLPFSTIFIVL